MKLKINEIFESIQGESIFAGMPCSFVRLSGCNLRCGYCDTGYAFETGEVMDINEICVKVEQFGHNLACVTGGEPLMQDGAANLVARLCEAGYTTLVETNGSVRVDCLPEKAIKVMDIKCPGSGVCDKMDWDNLFYLNPHDEVKFVVGSKDDYEWARDVARENNLEEKVKLLFAPVFGSLEAADMAQWMLTDKLKARLQIQLHKYLKLK